MPWYDLFKKFKDLVKFHVNINLSKFVNFEINIINSPSNLDAIQIDQKSKRITANFARLSKKEKQVVKKTIKSALIDHNYLLIEDSAEKTIKNIQKLESEPSSKEAIELLKDILTPIDLIAFRAALFLKNKYKDGDKETVKKLKDEIVRRFGERGAKIANLCSAGYFDEVIIPFVKEAKKDPGHLKDATATCYTFINESAFGVFVSAVNSNKKIKAMIERKIETNAKYGVKFVSVHGIGKSNVRKIRKAVDEILLSNPGMVKYIEREIADSIYIRLNIN